jgi:hypothetical protein
MDDASAEKLRQRLDENLGPVCRVCGDRITLANERQENAEREERLRPINALIQRLAYELDRGDTVSYVKAFGELAEQPKELLLEHEQARRFIESLKSEPRIKALTDN